MEQEEEKVKCQLKVYALCLALRSLYTQKTYNILFTLIFKYERKVYFIEVAFKHNTIRRLSFFIPQLAYNFSSSSSFSSSSIRNEKFDNT